MSASPLMPVPDLPLRINESIEVTANGSQVYVWCFGDQIVIEHDEAPILAAGILAAAGCENHRVVNLGGPLPEARRYETRIEVAGHASWPLGVIQPETFMADIRGHLAALEVWEKPDPHDPAEVEAIARALATHAEQADDIEPWRTDARIALDTIAALRAKS